MVPQFLEVQSDVVIQFLTTKFLLLGQELLADLEAAVLVDPVGSELSGGLLAAVAWASAVHSALSQGLALSLEVEAAVAVAAAV